MGKASQSEIGTGTGRTFRDHHAWCWNVKPLLPITGEVFDEIQLDGTYLTHGWCLLTAINSQGEIINWQWCNRETTAAYKALIAPIPPPRVVVTDGGSGLPAALADLWPNTLVQRCLVHVQRNIRTHVTTQPRTDAGKGLRHLSLALTGITTRDQAAEWITTLNTWHQTYGHLLKARTYAASKGAQRPTWAKANSTWWYTHHRLRRAYRLLERLVKAGHLFTYLDEHLNGAGISSTTNRIEGGINASLKALLRTHRGMLSQHQRRAVDWWCYLHTPQPRPTPTSFITPEHWQTTTKPHNNPSHQDTTPGGWGTTPTPNEGLWTRKGWAGRFS